MSNLLTIETAFLSNSAVKQALNLNEIRTLQRTLTNGQKKKFEQTLSLSKMVLNTLTWFESEDGQNICAEEGISWSKEDIANKIFGWQKSFFYKVVKAAKLDEAVIETFKTKCDEADAEGLNANRSLEGLLKFAKQVETTSEASGNAEGSEGEGEGEGETSEAQIETRGNNVLTLSYKIEGLKVNVKIDENGRATTSNSFEEIQQAINFLTQSIF